MKLNVLGLFSGVAGLELGLERAGMNIVGHVERDPYCQQVLTQHWPDVPLHDDVTTAPEWWLSTERPDVDVVCGGFPCQPFSNAGKQLGVADERWMWPETAAVIRAVQPRYVLLENVSALVRDSWAFGTVLSDLHSLGFNAEWATLRASDFGAPHGRERVYILANSTSLDGGAWDRMDESGDRRAPVTVGGLSGLDVHQRRKQARAWLASEPAVDRLADGIPNQSHRLRCAGNAVVPAIAEYMGQKIMAHNKEGEP